MSRLRPAGTEGNLHHTHVQRIFLYERHPPSIVASNRFLISRLRPLSFLSRSDRCCSSRERVQQHSRSSSPRERAAFSALFFARASCVRADFFAQACCPAVGFIARAKFLANDPLFFAPASRGFRRFFRASVLARRILRVSGVFDSRPHLLRASGLRVTVASFA